jgi:hypothetical protein
MPALFSHLPVRVKPYGKQTLIQPVFQCAGLLNPAFCLDHARERNYQVIKFRYFPYQFRYMRTQPAAKDAGSDERAAVQRGPDVNSNVVARIR